MKKSIIGGLAFLLTNCVTFHGNLDLAYVPTRIDDEIIKNELKVATEIWGEIPIGESVLYGGGKQTSFSGLPFKDGFADYTFEPDRITFDTYFGLRLNRNIDFYFNHMCSHPVSEKEVWLYDEENLEYRLLNYDDLTEIGVRINF